MHEQPGAEHDAKSAEEPGDDEMAPVRGVWEKALHSRMKTFPTMKGQQCAERFGEKLPFRKEKVRGVAH